MIVSERHPKYVFLQFPQAASTAIARELVEHYEGRRILRKHSNYRHFERWAGSSAGEFFTFSSIRNPLEKQVSLYHKFRSNHQGHFTNPGSWRRNGGWISNRELRRYRYITERDARFEDFFRRYFWLPFVDWSVLAHKELDFIIRYESIQEDFSRALDALGLQQIRPLPRGNPSKKKGDPDPSSLYPDAMRRRGCWVLGPMLEYWDYPVPPGWACRPSTMVPARLTFRCLSVLKSWYYHYLW